MANEEARLGGATIAGTLLGNTAQGASAGASVGAVPGAIIGGLAGLAVGGLSLAQQKRELEAAIAQQEALEAELDAVDNMAKIQQALQSGFGQREQAGAAQATEAAARLNLSPGAALELQRQAGQDIDNARAQATAQAGPAAAAADVQQKQEILNEFAQAQALADNAFSGSSATQEAFGALTGAVSALGQAGVSFGADEVVEGASAAQAAALGATDISSGRQVDASGARAHASSLVGDASPLIPDFDPTFDLGSLQQAQDQSLLQAGAQVGTPEFALGDLFAQQTAAQRSEFLTGPFTFTDLNDQDIDAMIAQMRGGL